MPPFFSDWLTTLLPRLLVAASLYAALLLAVYLGQEKLLYLPDQPSREIVATPREIGLDYETVWIVTADGVKLNGWYVEARRPRATLLFFHGNAGNISHRLDSLRIFNELGLTVLIIDYRGYGLSEGKPSEAGTQLDALAAWRYLTEKRGVAPRNIVLFGRSLGAALAAWLAAEKQPGAVILESAFTSVPDLAADLYWWLPARRLARLHHATRDYLARVHSPVLVVHSREDEIIPYRHGLAVYAAAGQPKAFLPLRGGHNDGFLLTGNGYVRGLDEFLTRHLRP